jgi:branched-chain amino acid transport system ATP-binding protein
MSTPLLEIDGLVVKYGGAVAVDGVSLRLEPGERVALIGPNGAGKTSLLSAVSGLVRPAGGSVRIDGADVTRAAPGRIVRLGVSMVPEGRQVFPSLSVEQNLLLGAFGRVARREPVTAVIRYAVERGRIRERLEGVYELLPKLHELRDRPAGRTSGGEQQMVAVGRALMADPRLLAIDELSLGLAPIVVQSLSSFLRELNESRGVALLLVEQNAHLAFDLCPRAYVLEAGQLRLEGPSAELRENPLVRSAYLGGGLEVAAG